MNLRRTVITLIGALLGLAAMPALASASTVCATGCDYPTIQEAVTAAADGETIDVHAGVYTGPVVINKPNLTISGEGAGATTVSAASPATVFTVGAGADGLSIEDLAVQGSSASGGTGISITALVTGLGLYGVHIRTAKFGVLVTRTGGAVTDWDFLDVSATGNYIGVNVEGPVESLTITGSGGLTSGGVLNGTFTGTGVGFAAIAATLDNQVTTSGVNVFVPAPPPPEPPPPPAPPTPPVTGEEQSVSPPSPPNTPPTVEQRRDARSTATEELGARTRADRTLTVGPALVFVPAPRTPTPDTPRIVGQSVRMDRTGLQEGDRQELMAISCPTLSCVATADITITYTDRRGRTHTVAIPAQSLELGEGQTGLVGLELPRAVRRAMLRGDRVRMNVGIALKSADGTSLGESSKTYTLKAEKKKRSKKSRR